ncbi:MAG: folate-binding Fe/S cluster repair protein [Moraxellaceae bacterium]|nr:folate-binding Fe/S cluster repair protein [Moraxellaceae bacterium]
MINLPKFQQIQLTGTDSIKFLQGQLTCNVEKLTDNTEHYQATAISNLKGRIQFALWIKKLAEDSFQIVLCADCMADFIAHIKKFGAFSKIQLTEPSEIYPTVIDENPTFSTDKNQENSDDWAKSSIATGNYWLTHAMQDKYQPQEMRLHQRGGVDYDKGCYLGQEVIARIYFKSSPKSYLQRIASEGETPKSGDKIGTSGKIEVINAITIDNNRFEALVIARPDLVEEFEVLPLPKAMSGGVARKN